MAGAVIGYLVSSALASTVAAEVVIAGLALDSAALITGATLIGGITGAVAGGVVGSAVNGAINGAGAQPASVSSGRSQGLLLNTSSNVEALPVVYGSRKVGGSRVLVESSGSSNEYLHLVLALCEGEIDSIGNIYLADTLATDAKYSGLVTLETYTGTDSQAASAALISAVPGKWSSAHTGSGVAYIYARLKYDANAFSGLPTITAEIRGKKVYDPRTSTTAYSNNPALCIRDYLTNSRYGRGISASLIDDASIISAANHCDELVSVPGGTQARYTCDGVLDVNNTAFDNLSALLTSCRGMLIYSAGVYQLVIDRVTSAGFAFTEDNITGGWQITQPGRRAKFNRVNAGFYNPASNWQPDFAISDSSAYRTQDNGLLLENKIDLPFTANLYRAQQLAGLALKASRFAIGVKFNAMQAGLRAEVGDVVSITHSTPGWNAKLFRVLQIEIGSDDEVSITAQEYDATVYNLDALSAITSTPSPGLPDPFAQVTLTGLSASSGTAALTIGSDGTVMSRIAVSWDLVMNTFVQAGQIQLEHALTSQVGSSTPPWQRVVLSGSSSNSYLGPVQDSANYTIRARAVTNTGVAGPWATITHTVIGKTAPPADVTSLTLSGTTLTWPPVTDIDRAGYRARFNYGSNTDWSVSAPLHDGLLTSSPYTLQVVPPGTITILLKAVDTSGNESTNPVYVITNLGNTLVANVVESYDERAASWPGTATNATVVAGNLQATQSDPFYNSNASAYFYPQDAADFYSTNFDALSYISAAFTPSLAATGSNLTLAWTLAGDAPAVQYRRTGPLPFYDDALAFFYAADTADFYSGASAWSSWPGSLRADNNQSYQFQLSTAGGPTSGLLSALAVSVDVPDKALKLNSVALNAAGSRLTGAIGSFNVIQNIQLTLQGGSTAVSLEITDKSATLGPLVIARNSAGTGVAATIDALLQGY